MNFPGRLLGCFVALTYVICASEGAETPATTNAVTAKSILADLYYESVSRSHLLAFVSREDDRPWYVDDALLILEFPKGEWMLVHAVRNPKYPPKLKRAGGPWMVHHVMDAPFHGHRRYDHLPTRKEMDQFLKDTQWHFGNDKFFRVVKREVDEETWQKVLNYKSPVFGGQDTESR